MPVPRRRKDRTPEAGDYAEAEALVARIRGEYSQMPGLRLTIAQASRLWQLDALTCEVLLEQLVRDAFLGKTIDGAYIALPPAPRAQARAQLGARVPFPLSA
jgi:hypothetical protein